MSNVRINTERTRIDLKRRFALVSVPLTLFGLLISATFHVAGAAGATLTISPSSGEYSVGQTISATIRLHSGGNPVNAAEATMNFSPDTIRLSAISRTGSIFSFWPAEPSYDNVRGIVSFGGGSPTPFTGSNGLIFTVTFSASKPGDAVLNFSGGRVLLADGSGADVFAGSQGAGWKVTAAVRAPPPPVRASTPAAPKVSSATHPDPVRWYAEKNPAFAWELPPDVTGVSFSLNSRPTADPGQLSVILIHEKSYENVSDGEWYFHIKFANRRGWGLVTHRRVRIDTRAPEPFTATFTEGRETENPQPVILFNTTDTLSGLSHYELKIGDGDFFTHPVEREHNPYRLPIQAPGKRTLLVKAIDRAGNAQAAPEEEFTILPFPRALAIPLFLKIILAVLLMINAILGYMLHHLLRFRKKVHLEVHEVESALHKAFDLLKEDMEEQVRLLEKTKSRRELTKEETKILRRLKQNLNDAERFIKKEIEDIA